jgi:hypothetical protein
LIVCSTDGYISIINFTKDELGKAYELPRVILSEAEFEKEQLATTITAPTMAVLDSVPTIPPCKPGQAAVLEARPTKKIRITPTLVSGSGAASTNLLSSPVMASSTSSIAPSSSSKRSICTEDVGAAVTKLSLGTEEKPKKKKRVQPMLISS